MYIDIILLIVYAFTASLSRIRAHYEGVQDMEAKQRRLRLIVTREGSSKRYAVSAALAITIPALATIAILALRLHPIPATILLIYLFVILFLTHQRGFGTAVFAAFIACILFDFFLVQPRFSLNISRSEERLDILAFLIFAIVLSYSYSHIQKRIEKAKFQKEQENHIYEKKLSEQSEEAKRRDHEIAFFSRVVYATQNEKDLRPQLQLMEHAIEEALSRYGIYRCTIFLPDLNSKETQQAQLTLPEKLSPDEKASLMWCINNGQSVMVRDSPLIERTKGNYLRRIVGQSAAAETPGCHYSFIAPLKSRGKIIGAIHLLVEDNGNPCLASIKQILETAQEPAGGQLELFTKFLEHTVYLIERTLDLREELRRRTEKLQTAIISSVSHDFHAPLISIKGAASSLLAQGTYWSNETEYQRTLEEIIEGADWLERILGRMLDLARIQNGQLQPKKELYPIDGIILNTLELGHMRSLIHDRHIEKCIPPDLPPVKVDPILIGQVLVNLLENAIRYTPASSPISLSVRADHEYLYISIADRGAGIPPPKREHIFEKFYRINQGVDERTGIAAPHGFGLGLAVCQGFVQAHDGHIWVEERIGGGAQFIFTLPLREARADHEETHSGY